MHTPRLLRSLLAALLIALGSAPATARQADARQPNILLITADDLNWDGIGAFGSPVADATPNLDRLAAEGMRFEQAHVTIAVCQPSRSVLMTGRYPHRNGARGFGPIRTDVPTVPELLGQAGYLSGILGKVTHLQPIEKFGWAMAYDQPELGQGRDPERYYRHAKAFIQRAQREGRPFFLMANSHDPHRPFHGSEDEKRKFGDELASIPEPSRVYRPEEVTVPGFLPDLPGVREEVAQYYSSVRRLDDFVGAVLRALEEAGQAENTLVMFLSDNGMAFPFAKTNGYLNSTRTPWIVRWPGRVRAGAVDRTHLISGIDFLPTVLEAAGLGAPEGIDGRSFLPVLHGRTQPERDRVVTVFHETSARREYPIRALQDGRLGYIYNAWADGETVFRNESQIGLTFAAMKQAAETDPEVAGRVHFFLHRVPEELYDLRNDPDARHNLAADPRYHRELEAMRKELLDWMRRTKDDLLPTYRQHLQHFGTE